MSKESIDLDGKTILVAGSPGFIGANLVVRLLRELYSGTVVSFDNMNDYYDVSLQEYRLAEIDRIAESCPTRHLFIRGTLTDKRLLNEVFAEYKPDLVVNLAAQAGVRYSIEHPDAYIDSNRRHEYCRPSPSDSASSGAVHGIPAATDVCHAWSDLLLADSAAPKRSELRRMVGTGSEVYPGAELPGRLEDHIQNV